MVCVSAAGSTAVGVGLAGMGCGVAEGGTEVRGRPRQAQRQRFGKDLQEVVNSPNSSPKIIKERAKDGNTPGPPSRLSRLVLLLALARDN